MRWLKVLLALAIVVVAIGAVVAGAVYFVTEDWLDETYQVAVPTIEIPADPDAIFEGRRLATTRGCVDCHGPDLGGNIVVDDPMVGLISGSNLTSGGVAARYDDAAWQRAIRHGIGFDGRPLFLMPSHEYYPMSDADLGALSGNATKRLADSVTEDELELGVNEGRQAVIVSSEADYGTIRAYISWGVKRPRVQQVFYTRDEAESWLAGTDGTAAGGRSRPLPDGASPRKASR